MPPKLDKDSPTAAARFSIAASESLLQRIEEWRAEQRPIPNKSEAARILIEFAFDVINSNPEAMIDFEKRRAADKAK